MYVVPTILKLDLMKDHVGIFTVAKVDEIDKVLDLLIPYLSEPKRNQIAQARSDRNEHTLS